MERISSTNSLGNSLQKNWEYVKKLDESTKTKEALAGGLSERIGRSAKYRLQSESIKHSTNALLKNRWDAELFKQGLNQNQRLAELAKTASSGAHAVTYEALAQHIRSGGAINAFNWKGLLKSRGWHHVDHVTCVTEGTAGAIGKAIAMNVAKFFIIYDAVKDAKTTYKNSRNEGKSSISSALSAVFTAAKEIGKSLASWEAGALGAAIATVMLPGLGIAGAIGGAILLGGLTGYLLERFAPSPVEEKVSIRQNNPFV